MFTLERSYINLKHFYLYVDKGMRKGDSLQSTATSTLPPPLSPPPFPDLFLPLQVPVLKFVSVFQSEP